MIRTLIIALFALTVSVQAQSVRVCAPASPFFAKQKEMGRSLVFAGTYFGTETTVVMFFNPDDRSWIMVDNKGDGQICMSMLGENGLFGTNLMKFLTVPAGTH